MKKFLSLLILFFGCRSNIDSEAILKAHPRETKIIESIDTFYKSYITKLKGKRVLLVTNPSGIGNNPERLIQSFKDNDIEIKSLLGLEHGFLGLEEDFSNSPVTLDPTFKIPIYHIYKLKSNELSHVLEDIDVILFSVQDMGMRCYTYLTVLKRILDEQTNSQELIILDSVNIGMEYSPRGNFMQKGLENFAGEFPLLFLTGLSLGESANYYNAEFLRASKKVTVIPVENYNRGTKFERTGIPWNTPSPNLPTLDSARNYLGLVLLEGINVSVGRGTQAPFIYFGAPWMNFAEEIKSELNERTNDYYFQTVYFKPSFSKYKDQICKGLRLTVVNSAYDPIEMVYNLILSIKNKSKKNFQWNSGKQFTIDILWGNDSFRKSIDSGVSYKEFARTLAATEQKNKEKIEKYLIYKP
ncbi:MAG: DUF1343 domain-containing protein [Leptospiraceae bacterium]|nr:DUF1343 domain-containing protein [Leptospiraceae bacterium]